MSCEVVRKLGSFRLTAPADVLGHLGDISLKLPNFLTLIPNETVKRHRGSFGDIQNTTTTTSQDVTKGADQANRVLQLHLHTF